MLPPLKDRKVLFFGFSVTEETHGYIFELKRRFRDQINIESRAIGGLALWAVPYILEHLKVEEYDEIIFEISTCLRYSEKEPQRYHEDLSYILYFCSSKKVAIRFLQLYRGDVKYDADELSKAVHAFCIEKKVREISLIETVKNIDASNELKTYLRDGTHTSSKGAVLYAEKIFEKLREDSNQVNDYQVSLLLTKEFMSLEDCTLLDVTGTFERRGVEFSTFDIQEGSKFKVTVPTNCQIVGVWYIKGPTSGVLEISLNDNSYHKIIGYDQFSYYSRYTVWKVPKNGIAKMAVFHTAINPKVSLVKGEKYEGKRLTRLCGLLIDRKLNIV